MCEFLQSKRRWLVLSGNRLSIYRGRSKTKAEMVLLLGVNICKIDLPNSFFYETVGFNDIAETAYNQESAKKPFNNAFDVVPNGLHEASRFEWEKALPELIQISSGGESMDFLY